MNRTAKPLGDRVLLKINDVKDNKTAGGIIIPETAKLDDVREAEVVAVSSGYITANGTLMNLSVKEGDRVLLAPHNTGQKVKLGDNEYHLVRESEILMILN
jgi:chaperonin GroES